MNTRIFKALILALTAAMTIFALADEGHDKLTAALKQKMAAKDYAGVCEDCDRALGAAGLDARQKIDLLAMKAAAFDKQGNWKSAVAEYAKITADPAADNASKIRAGSSSADVLRRKNRSGEAGRLLRGLLDLPELSSGEKLGIHLELARVSGIAGESELALKECEKAWALPGLDVGKDRIQIIKTALATGHPDTAMKWSEEILALPQLKDREKTAIQLVMAGHQANTRQAERLKESIDKVLAMPDGAGKANNALRELGRLWPEYADSALAQYAWETLLQQERLPIGVKEEAWQGLIMIGLRSGRFADAQKIADTAGLEKELAAPQRFRFAVVKLGIEALANGKPLPAGDVDRAARDLQLSVPDKLDALYKAGQILMAARDDRPVRAILALTDGMFKKNDKTYLCRYVESPPQGAGAWLDSELLKNSEMREGRFLPYDQSAADQLLMDVSVERGFDADKARDKSIYLDNTAFCMVYDRDGIHLFVECGEPNMEQVRLDGAKAGKLELFCAPGRDHQAYRQWIAGLDTENLQVFDWNSPHRQYRSIRKFIKAESATADQGWGIAFFISWEAFYDSLPFDTGEDWLFDLIRWTPAGGVSWSGALVHKPGKWGAIQWQAPTPEQRLQIKSHIARKAWTRYRPLRDEAVWRWQKSNLGDAGFYNDCLAPEIKRLDGYGERLKEPAKLSAGEVEELYRKAVPDWMEFDYLVSELRATYLAEQLFAGVKNKK